MKHTGTQVREKPPSHFAALAALGRPSPAEVFAGGLATAARRTARGRGATRLVLPRVAAAAVGLLLLGVCVERTARVVDERVRGLQGPLMEWARGKARH